MTSIGLLLLFLILKSVSAQNPCPDRRAVCINIRNCPPMIEILKRPRPLSQESLNILRNSQCGYDGNDPKVCCVNEPSTQTTGTQPVPQPVPRPVPRPVPQPMPLANQDDMPEPPDVTNHPNLRLLDHNECGHIIADKLIGGNKTGVFEFPWMALIAYDTGRRVHEFRCGGTVISSRYVLTAAHCVTTLPGGIRLSGVRVGDHDISKERDCDLDENGLEVLCGERYQDFGIESYHFHPGYTRRKLQNDIALIRLNGTIDFRPLNSKPICLPYGTAMRINSKKVVVTGWGATENGTRSYDLLKVKIPLVSNEQCKQAYRSSTEIWYKQMCAGGQRNIDSCPGDSGGPLQAPGIYNGNKVRYVQYGVVSYGLKQCGTEGTPGVYTRVSHYVEWILNTMRD